MLPGSVISLIIGRVAPRLARIRGLLAEPFPTALGPDKMDELERLMQDVPHWTESHPEPPPSWQEDVWKPDTLADDGGGAEVSIPPRLSQACQPLLT